MGHCFGPVRGTAVLIISRYIITRSRWRNTILFDTRMAQIEKFKGNIVIDVGDVKNFDFISTNVP